MSTAAQDGQRILAVIGLALWSAACGSDESGHASGADAGPADCAPGERPVDGRGCLAAGVQDNGCPAGTLALEDGSCRPAGVPPEMCAEGFEPDGQAGCAVILPAKACAKGLMAVPGETTCRAVAPCAPGTFGSIPVEPSTQHVDAAYAGTGSDGTAAKPWTTIQQGVDAADPGAIVAVAAGSYTEDVVISDKPVRLWGRCPSMVEIVGSADNAAVLVEKASGAEVRDLALSGGVGFLLTGGDDVIVDRVWIHESVLGGFGALGDVGGTSVELSRSLVEGNQRIGLSIQGSTATIRETVVRDTQPLAADQLYGGGMIIVPRTVTGARGSATVRGSVVEGNRFAGVVVAGSDATIEATVVRDTQPQAADQVAGDGIYSGADPDTNERANLTVRASLVEGNHTVGMFVRSDATIEATVVRDTQPQASDQTFGVGICIQPEDGQDHASATLRASLVDGNRNVGVYANNGSDVLIEATVVRDTKPQASDQQFGRGIAIEDDPTTGARGSATVRSSLVERNHDLGVFIAGTDATIEATVVRDTQPGSDGFYGDGLCMQAGGTQVASTTVTACVVAGSARAGIASFGARTVLSSTSFDCNVIHIDGEQGSEPDGTPDPNVTFSFDDGGGNDCGCTGKPVPCKVLSTGLAPPGAAM